MVNTCHPVVKGFLYLLLGLVWTPHAASARQVIRTITEVRSLAPEQTGKDQLVVIEAQVLRGDRNKRGIFVYDGKEGIYVQQAQDNSLLDDIAVGDVIRIKGVADPGSYLPAIEAESVVVTGRKPLPLAPPLLPGEIQNASLDCQWRSIEGRLVDMVDSAYLQAITLTFEMYGGLYKVQIPHRPGEMEKVSKLMFNRVRFDAVVGTVHNRGRQFTGRIFFANSADSIKPVGTHQVDMQYWDIHELLRVNFDLDQVVRTRGTITHCSGREVFLRGSQESLKAVLLENVQVSPGDIVELSGIAWPLPIKPSFRAESIRITGTTESPVPLKMEHRMPFDSRYHHELVQVDAEVVDVGESFGPAQEHPEQERIISLLCRAEGFQFRAAFRSGAQINPDRLGVGSMLRLTGVCHLILDDDVSWEVSATGFRLQLRDENDILVLKPAPWWTAEHLLWASVILITVLCMVLVWVISLHRTVNRQTGIITEKIEQESILHERQRVARELHDNLDQGLTGTAVQLKSCRIFFEEYRKEIAGALRELIDNAALEREKEQLTECLAVVEDDGMRGSEALQAVQDMLSYCGKEARSAILDLRGGLLERMRFPQALQEALEQVMDSSSAEFIFKLSGSPKPLIHEAERNLLLIAREAVTNAVQHAGAEKICVELAYTASSLEIRITDDGCGYDKSRGTPAGRFGLQGMEERSAQLGGILNIASGIDEGTVIELVIPDRSAWEIKG